MSRPIDPPAGFITLPLPGGCILVIPERVYLAGLRLGKQLTRRAVLVQRTEAMKGEHERATE